MKSPQLCPCPIQSSPSAAKLASFSTAEIVLLPAEADCKLMLHDVLPHPRLGAMSNRPLE